MEAEVIMYMAPIWPHCVRAKRFLAGKGIQFKQKNIIFPKVREEMQALTDSMTIPVTKVGDRVLVGFSQAEYEEAFRDYRSAQ